MNKLYKVFYIRKFEIWLGHRHSILHRRSFDIYPGCWAIFHSEDIAAESRDEAICKYYEEYSRERLEHIFNSKIDNIYIYSFDKDIEDIVNIVDIQESNIYNIKDIVVALDEDEKESNIRENIIKYMGSLID